MTDLRTAAQQALEALEYIRSTTVWQADKHAANPAITALKAALEQPEKEKPRSATSHIGTYYGRKNPALAQPRQFTFAPKPPSPPPAPQGYDGTEAGLHDFSWSNHV